MLKRTPLYDAHVEMGAKLVDFAGWDMPIHYSSQLTEHHQVRNGVGMFDVSHMAVMDLHGDEVQAFLQYLLANDVGRLKVPGKALYSCMLNQQAGVIDDLIVYHMRSDWYRLVVNAGTREKDLAWIEEQASAFTINVETRDDLAMIAVQGPAVLDACASILPPAAAELARFSAMMHSDWFIARTGYTGEDGFEIILPGSQVVTLWQRLAAQGVAPIGLGARDTLRLEAGMNLYGSDMDESTSPLESGLAWTIAWQPDSRNFIGRASLAAQREQGVPRKLVGLLLNGRGVLRAHQKVISEAGEGEITSGTFSPTLKQTIALARVPATMGDQCQVEIRGKQVAASVVKYPFVRDGKVLV